MSSPVPWLPLAGVWLAANPPILNMLSKGMCQAQHARPLTRERGPRIQEGDTRAAQYGPLFIFTAVLQPYLLRRSNGHREGIRLPTTGPAIDHRPACRINHRHLVTATDGDKRALPIGFDGQANRQSGRAQQ